MRLSSQCLAGARNLLRSYIACISQLLPPHLAVHTRCVGSTLPSYTTLISVPRRTTQPTPLADCMPSNPRALEARPTTSSGHPRFLLTVALPESWRPPGSPRCHASRRRAFRRRVRWSRFTMSARQSCICSAQDRTKLTGSSPFLRSPLRSHATQCSRRRRSPHRLGVSSA
jgi:hypothetical protein